MSIPNQFPHVARDLSASADTLAAEATAGRSRSGSAVASRPWLMAALLLSLAAQAITISALAGADPIPASWAALLLAIAPGPLAFVAYVAPAPVPRFAAPLAVVVLLIGIIGQIARTGLFFLPALATMVVAALILWRGED